jgi:hypothetical protein
MKKKICMASTRGYEECRKSEKKKTERSHPWKVAVNPARYHGGAEYAHDTNQ